MKQYPSISRDIIYGKPIYAFDKLDGSNIRAEWSAKKGFWKFGSRNVLIDNTHQFLGECPNLITEKYTETLNGIFRKLKLQKTICFFEFFGENSFAGNHENENHDVVLFDVWVYKKGLMSPKKFVKTFTNVDTANLLYVGTSNKEFEQSVRCGSLDGMTFEGVVCKGKNITPHIPLMFKIKNTEWLYKLKNTCKDNEEYEKLK